MKKAKKLSKFLNPEEIDMWKKYHKRGCTHYVRCKIDQVNLDLNTSKEHRIGILKLAIKAVRNKEHFITEAVPTDDPKRRVDFVGLKSGEVEVETNPKNAERHNEIEGVEVVLTKHYRPKEKI